MERTPQQIINHLSSFSQLPDKTVDGLIWGDGNQQLTGIAVCYMPTAEVIREAESKGCNLLITHEGLFHSHDPGEQSGSPVNQIHTLKEEMLIETGMAVYRFHDGPHHMKPDLLTDGLIRNVGWNSIVSSVDVASSIVTLRESCSVQDILAHLKSTLHLSHIRLTGNSESECKRIGVSAGDRRNSQVVVSLFTDQEVDVVITGECHEWEAPEFVRDANAFGKEYALIVLGHGESEVPGMIKTSKLLTQSFPDIPVHFIGYDPVFHVK